MKKKSQKQTRSKIIDKLDAEFSRFIRLRDCDKHGIVVCPLCGAKNHRKESQNMHFISRKISKYRRDENNCYAGCKRCNVLLHGNYIQYTLFMQKKFGVKKVDEMVNDKKPFKISTPELEEMLEYYKGRAKDLESKLKEQGELV